MDLNEKYEKEMEDLWWEVSSKEEFLIDLNECYEKEVNDLKCR